MNKFFRYSILEQPVPTTAEVFDLFTILVGEHEVILRLARHARGHQLIDLLSHRDHAVVTLLCLLEKDHQAAEVLTQPRFPDSGLTELQKAGGSEMK